MGYTARLIGLELAMLDEVANEKLIPVDQRDLGWIAFAAFGNTGKSAVSSLFAAELYLAALSFILMSSINVQLLLGVDLAIALLAVGIACGILQVFLAVDPEHCMMLLATASKVSVIALVVTACGLIISGLVSMSLIGPAHGKYDIITPAFPQALGTMLFMFAGHPCFPQIYYAMKEPAISFQPAVRKAFSIAGTIYMVVGLTGYLLYADSIQQSFMSNLGVTTDGITISSLTWLRVFCQVAMTIKIIGVFPLVGEPVLATILPGADYSTQARVLQRLIFAVITTMVAFIVKNNLAEVCAIAGGLLTMGTSVLVPCSTFLKLTHREEMNKADLLANVGCLCFGVCGLIFCTWTSVKSLMEK